MIPSTSVTTDDGDVKLFPNEATARTLARAEKKKQDSRKVFFIFLRHFRTNFWTQFDTMPKLKLFLEVD